MRHRGLEQPFRAGGQLVSFSNDTAVFVRAERLFCSIREELRRLLPLAEIHHVGSTAIRGSLTKGDLDILVRVGSELFAEADEVLSGRFERNHGSDRTDEFSAFMDPSTVPELGVQLVTAGGAADNFLAWRDLLQNDEAVRQAYDELKLRFEGQSMEAYRAAKSSFIASRLAW